MKYKVFITSFLFSVFLITAGLLKPLFADSIEAVTIAGITDKSPLEYKTAASLPTGAYVELWKLWSEKTGIAIKYIITTKEHAEKELLNGRIDVIMGYPASPDALKKFNLIPDIYNADIYIYRSKGIAPVETFRDLQPYRTGITPAVALKFGDIDFDISLLVKGGAAELIDAFSRGEINVFLGEEAETNHLLIRRGEWKNLIQSSEPVISYGISAAVAADNKYLTEKISEGFNKISDAERLVIQKTWAGGNIKHRIPWGYIGTIAVILIIIGGVAVIWWWNFQLQRKVDSATEELTAMKEEAEAANLAKSRFLDNISHELRTPLTLILAPVEDAINGRPLCRENLEMIQRNSRSLLSLINDLLDLSRITSGRMKLNVSETDLGRAVKLYGAEMESVAEYNGLSLNCSIPEEPVMAYIDRAKFSGIISNFFQIH